MQIHQSGTPKCDNITTKEEAQNYYILTDRELMWEHGSSYIYMYMGMGLNVLIEIKNSVFIHLCECCVFFTLIDNPCTFELKSH